MSKRYLLYARRAWSIVRRRARMGADRGGREIVAALRTLLSEGRLVHGTVDTEGNRRVARRIEKDGPTGL